jgi:hypothetical protein
MENIGIEYVAARARAEGFSVEIVNAGLHGLSIHQMLEIVRNSSFLVLGISAIHWTLETGLQIAEAAKRSNNGCHVVFGGLEAALNYESILEQYPSVDSICLGEGENVIVDLLSCCAGGKDWRSITGIAFRRGGTVTANLPPILHDDLDTLPNPVRDDIPAVSDLGGPVTISTSRGCFGNCSFCSVKSFYRMSKGRKWRGRSPVSVVQELQHINRRYGTRLFSFIDETVVGPGLRGHERVARIAQGIIDAKLDIEFFLTIRADQITDELFALLKQAGLRKVEIGIESMAESQLRRYGKTATVDDNRKALAVLDRLDIASEAFMIPFDSRMTAEEMQENLSFYRRRFRENTHRYDVAPLTMGDYVYPYPGTEMKSIYEEIGVLSRGYYSPFQAVDPVITRVQHAAHKFISLVETAFPMSYSGIGNLWVNSAGLSGDTYREICSITSDIGLLNADFIEWAYRAETTGSQSIFDSVTDFVDAAERLRKRFASIVAQYGAPARTYTADSQAVYATDFSRDLHGYGRKTKAGIIDTMYLSPLNKEQVAEELARIIGSDGEHHET